MSSMVVLPTALRGAVRGSAGGPLLPMPGAVPPVGMGGAYVYDAPSAWRIPAVARAVQLYGGLMSQMALNVYRGSTPLPIPPICRNPDPNRTLQWFVAC